MEQKKRGHNEENSAAEYVLDDKKSKTALLEDLGEASDVAVKEEFVFIQEEVTVVENGVEVNKETITKTIVNEQEELKDNQTHDSLTKEEKINRLLKQLEFYMGNSNLPKDKFLNKQLSENDGWVPIDTFLTFNRVKGLTNTKDDLVQAIEGSKELLEMDEKKEKVKRKSPLVERNPLKYTLYIKGFQTSMSLDDLEAYFHEKKIEPVSIRQLKDQKTKQFNGEIFLELGTEEDVKGVLKEGLRYKDSDLELARKEDYHKHKDKGKKGKKQVQEPSTQSPKEDSAKETTEDSSTQP